MVKIKLLQGKKTPKSKSVYFWGYKDNGKLMQVGGSFRKKSRALQFGKKEFSKKR